MSDNTTKKEAMAGVRERADEVIKELNLDETLVELRREFHRHPELSGKEYETMERICGYLDEWGIPYTKGVADTGVVALIEGAKPGRTVGLRADIDALPIEEENTEAPYCSVNPGVMHACGHDAHLTMLLGAARVLSAVRAELTGSVKLFFQPNEEDTGGAERMIKEGCLENPHVDYVLGLHVNPSFRVGTVGVRYGKMYAASDMLTVAITGKSAHGAHPDEGTDAIIVAANILNTLQTVVSRTISPVNSAVCTFGTIRGGRVRNQIADHVVMEGIMRTLDPETRAGVREKIRRICGQVADAMGAKAELTVDESYGPLINTDEVVDVAAASARELLGEENVITEAAPELGTEDFSYFAAARPSCFFHLGCASPEDEAPVDLHNSRFDIDERCLGLGVRLQVRNVLALLEQD